MPTGAARVGNWYQNVAEIVTEVTVIRHSWGPDSSGGNHGITFTWKTSHGRTGRVSSDIHISKQLADVYRRLNMGAAAYNGVYARSLIGKNYQDNAVKDYLNAGTQFDQRPPSQW